MENEIKNEAINPSNGNDPYNRNTTNNNNNKTSTFNLVIGIATLLIAILGATFAYFTATAGSAENDVTVKSAFVSIGYEGGTEIKASHLIPATEQVALTKYQKELAPYDPEVDGDMITEYDEAMAKEDQFDRRCVDAKGREVCFVYQFYIENNGSDSNADILAYIKINTNEFSNLNYVLYEVEYEHEQNGDPKSAIIMDKYGIGIVKKESYKVVSNFSKVDSSSDNVDYAQVKFETFEKPIDRFGDNGEYIETIRPLACLFKYSDDAISKEMNDPTRCEKFSLTGGRHYYQLVIWLGETGKDQNIEQANLFEGTVAIEVVGGNDYSDYENGQITGEE